MKHLRLYIICLLLMPFYMLSSNPLKPKNLQNTFWVQIKASDKYQRTDISNLGFAIHQVEDDFVGGVASQKLIDTLNANGFETTVVGMEDYLLDYPIDDERFHNYQELMEEIDYLAQMNPGVVQLSFLSDSLEGRKIPFLTISANPDPDSQPAALIMGGHHAREHLSVEMPLMLAKYLISEWRNFNKDISSLLEKRTIYIVPIVNPDGAEFDINTGSYKLWRKNRRQNNGSSYGVDLNRNYGYKWGTSGTSSNPDSDVYKGPKPFSEIETQNIKGVIETHTNINTMISFHSFSKLILYPWGHGYDPIDNAQDKQVFEKMAKTMSQWNGYKPMQASELYAASGDTVDWAYAEHKIFGFTFELDPDNSVRNPRRGFYPGQSFIEPTFNKNIEAMLYLIEAADNPYKVLKQ